MESGRYMITLMRFNEVNEWVQLTTSSFLIIAAGSITIRDCLTNSLQGDLPFIAIEKIDTISTVSLVRITASGGNLIAFKFHEVTGMNKFKGDLNKFNISFSEVEKNNFLEFPDLNQPFVQEYILKLLFSENFNEFVNELEELITGFKTKLGSFLIKDDP